MRAQSNRRRLPAPGRVPDPLRAHGAWVYLVVSALAGAAVAPRGPAVALLAAGGFVGLFVLGGSVAIAGRRGAVSRLTLGLVLTIGSPAASLLLGAERSFLLVALGAVAPAGLAALLAAHRGFLSPGVLALGVTALTVAAPLAARAGAAPLAACAHLFLLLTPFFLWRTWRLAAALGEGWTRPRLRRRGLVESALAIVWSALAVAATRWLG